ncbi:polysaccharide biosynthesis/export family protein [Janthinobacterium sp. B9-8]|uniref:polysaccharide biosynthesis/export family protein n=1 Tax=Janthinobacterium sp. B9-8 TaxID=1236179 RepID=UPI00069B333F|nr:polysaccharide biosynthesis/export family protein [Janthinobacterium sp. B9-8]AMC36791.1 polysaccharide export protein EpsE [Janthinobacterium sp. B9-8]
MKATQIVAFVLMLFCSCMAMAAANSEYRLGPGDIVKISVYDHPDLSTELQLNEQGSVAFPLLGEVKLLGLPYTEAQALIANGLKKGGFVNQPNVSVLISQYRSQRIAVIGEVNKAGRYALDGATDMVDLLAIAGGLNANAGDTVVVLRGAERIEYRLSQAMKLGDQTKRSMPIANGDVVYVPRAQQFYVYGEVNRPGVYRMEPKMTVMQALAVSGGFNPRASHRNLEIHRIDQSGAVIKVEANLSDLLVENDTLFVKESLF